MAAISAEEANGVSNGDGGLTCLGLYFYTPCNPVPALKTSYLLAGQNGIEERKLAAVSGLVGAVEDRAGFLRDVSEILVSRPDGDGSSLTEEFSRADLIEQARIVRSAAREAGNSAKADTVFQDWKLNV